MRWLHWPWWRCQVCKRRLWWFQKSCGVCAAEWERRMEVAMLKEQLRRVYGPGGDA